MTDTITPTPTRWSMYGSDGNDFLTREMDDLASRVRANEVRATDLYDEIRSIQRRATTAGFGEVHDTEPEWAIVDFVYALCDEQGWAPIGRQNF